MNEFYKQAMKEGREDEAAALVSEDPRITESDLGMMKRPDLWPNWPRLPVKKSPWQVGFMIEGVDGEAIPRIYDHRTIAPLYTYSNLQEVIDDDWVVD